MFLRRHTDLVRSVCLPGFHHRHLGSVEKNKPPPQPSSPINFCKNAKVNGGWRLEGGGGGLVFLYWPQVSVDFICENGLPDFHQTLQEWSFACLHLFLIFSTLKFDRIIALDMLNFSNTCIKVRQRNSMKTADWISPVISARPPV